MIWRVPDVFVLNVVHELSSSVSFGGQGTTRYKRTSRIVRRPERGTASETVTCGHCHRDVVFVIQDMDTTRRLRRGPVLRSLLWSTVIIAVVVACAVIGFGSGSAVFVVLTFAIGVVFLPIGIALLFSPTGQVGVQRPEPLYFGTTKRDGMNWVTKGDSLGRGISCIGNYEAAPRRA